MLLHLLLRELLVYLRLIILVFNLTSEVTLSWLLTGSSTNTWDIKINVRILCLIDIIRIYDYTCVILLTVRRRWKCCRLDGIKCSRLDTCNYVLNLRELINTFVAMLLQVFQNGTLLLLYHNIPFKGIVLSFSMVYCVLNNILRHI